MFETDTSALLIFSEDAQKTLRHWYSELQAKDHQRSFNGRVWRAELRRIHTPWQALTCEGCNVLLQQMKKKQALEKTDTLALALFTCVVVYARRDKPGMSFAAQLSERFADRPCLSALRFRRLQTSRTPEALATQLIRAVRIRGEQGINICSLADDIALWMREYQKRQEYQTGQACQPAVTNPFHRLDVRWASEYARHMKD